MMVLCHAHDISHLVLKKMLLFSSTLCSGINSCKFARYIISSFVSFFFLVLICISTREIKLEYEEKLEFLNRDVLIGFYRFINKFFSISFITNLEFRCQNSNFKLHPNRCYRSFICFFFL